MRRLSLLPAALLLAVPGRALAEPPAGDAETTRVRVLTGVSTVVLELLGPSSGPEAPWPEWRKVCDAPCDAVATVSGLYRVRSEWFTPSQTFTLLHAPTTEIVVDISLRTDVGRALTVAGFVTALVSGAIALVGAVAQSPRTTVYTALGFTAGGAAIGFTGLGLTVSGDQSLHVETRPARAASPSGLGVTLRF
jgi:hypothetical protein